jgi:hypothetical protein
MERRTSRGREEAGEKERRERGKARSNLPQKVLFAMIPPLLQRT